ncbi:MAG: SIS domain-containing protein [Bacillota bacterium]
MKEELARQLTFAPIVRRALEAVPEHLVIGGMGGSALSGDALAFLLPHRHTVVHRGYGLPAFTPSGALHIAVSYSGNTEETISFANAALRQGRRLAVVASGGTLADFAEREHLPLVLVPAGHQPRNALLSMTKALLVLAGEEEVAKRLESTVLDMERLTEEAEEDAHFILPSVPLIYASSHAAVLGRIGKILLNETGRTPAFTNVFSELNHNEMQAFDTDMPEGLEHLFRFVVLIDGHDPRIVRRMETFRSVMEDRGRMVRMIDLSQHAREGMLIETWYRFAYAAQALAETRGIDPGTVPLIEAFKRLL